LLTELLRLLLTLQLVEMLVVQLVVMLTVQLVVMLTDPDPEPEKGTVAETVGGTDGAALPLMVIELETGDAVWDGALVAH
jgi:hypothetical protein